MAAKRKIMLLQTRYIESISYLSDEIVKAFPLDSYEVTKVYLEKAEAVIDADGCEQIFLGLDKTDYKGLRLRAIKTLGSFLKEHHFDVIIANMYKPINLLMQLRGSISASLCIGIIHAFGEFDRLGRRWMMRWMIDSRWRMVAVSEPLRDYLINARCGLNLQNTIVISNAIDLQVVEQKAMDRSVARQFLRLPETGYVIGTVGRSVKGKRQMELLRAFHHFAANHADVYLVIIGDGELHKELETYVFDHGLEKKVFLPGQVPDAVRYLRALDLFVFPSEHEGFGMALLEAMALGLPVVVNRIEPLLSILGDDRFAVDTSDLDAFSNRLDYCVGIDFGELASIGYQNFQRAINVYGISSYRQSYLTLVENCLPKCCVN